MRKHRIKGVLFCRYIRFPKKADSTAFAVLSV